MKVFVIEAGYYEALYVAAVFSTREKAEQYVQKRINIAPKGSDASEASYYRIQEMEVDTE